MGKKLWGQEFLSVGVLSYLSKDSMSPIGHYGFFAGAAPTFSHKPLHAFNPRDQQREVQSFVQRSECTLYPIRMIQACGFV